MGTEMNWYRLTHAPAFSLRTGVAHPAAVYSNMVKDETTPASFIDSCWLPGENRVDAVIGYIMWAMLQPGFNWRGGYKGRQRMMEQFKFEKSEGGVLLNQDEKQELENWLQAHGCPSGE